MKRRKKVNKDIAARNQAQHDVIYFTEYLEREKIRAKAIVMYAGASEGEADAIVYDAEQKLADAQERLEALF